VIAYSGMLMRQVDLARLVFVDAPQVEAGAMSDLAAAGKICIVFGDSSLSAPPGAKAVEGALTPHRIERCLKEFLCVTATEKQPDAPAVGATETLDILVAEDTVTNQEVLGALLRGMGHRVEIAQNGLEAVRRVESGAFHLVFMDVHMPVMDGLEAARRIRLLPGPKGEVRIVALTASAFPSDIAACRSAGMDDFTSKPINRKKLAAALAGLARPSAEVRTACADTAWE
jgi:CheY-like chemotaxis protein